MPRRCCCCWGALLGPVLLLLLPGSSAWQGGHSRSGKRGRWAEDAHQSLRLVYRCRVHTQSKLESAAGGASHLLLPQLPPLLPAAARGAAGASHRGRRHWLGTRRPLQKRPERAPGGAEAAGWQACEQSGRQVPAPAWGAAGRQKLLSSCRKPWQRWVLGQCARDRGHRMGTKGSGLAQRSRVLGRQTVPN